MLKNCNVEFDLRMCVMFSNCESKIASGRVSLPHWGSVLCAAFQGRLIFILALYIYFRHCLNANLMAKAVHHYDITRFKMRKMVMWSRKLPGWTNQKHKDAEGDSHIRIWFLRSLNFPGGIKQEKEKLWKEMNFVYSGLCNPEFYLEEPIKKIALVRLIGLGVDSWFRIRSTATHDSELLRLASK